MGVKVDYANKINAQDLDTIYITGGGFIRRAFKGVSRDSAWGWEEPVWGGDLTRSKDFILTNIETVDFGLVARCEISYKYMNVQDYIDLMRISKERVVVVDYFNRETGKRVTQQMAFTGNELGKLYAFGTDYLGNQDVKIKLVATNKEKADLIKSKITITYNANSGVGSISSQTANWSDEIVLFDNSSGEFAKTGSHITQWNTKQDGTGDAYGLGEHITCWNDLNLYAIWSTEVGLSYITYDAQENGGNFGSESEYTYIDTLNLNQSVDLSTEHRYGIKENWEFVGWNTNKYATVGLTTLTATDEYITLYAIYKKQISVQFYQVGETSSSSIQSVTLYNKETSRVIQTPQIPARANMTISGWNDNNYRLIPNIVAQSAGTLTVNDNIELYATYTYLVTLTYNANGGTGYMSPERGYAYLIADKTDKGYERGYTFKLKECNYMRTEYVFDGWGYTPDEPPGQTALVGDSLVLSSDFTVYAIWSEE